MPSTRAIEAFLRAHGWRPAPVNSSIAYREWIFVDDIEVKPIKVPRTDFQAPSAARKILLRAKL